MSYQHLIFEVKEGIALLTFNRPKVLNAINAELLAELDQVLDQTAKDESIRVLILTGAGEKAFIAGADIGYLATLDPLGAKSFSLYGQGVLAKLARLPQPTIACVGGFALGGGLETALACDFIYAADTAKFGQPEINLGVIPGFGGTQRLARRIGPALAKELCLTGAMLSAEEALKIGLVNKVFPKEKLLEETMKTAKLLATKGRVSLREAKRVIEEGYNLDLDKALAIEADRFAICYASPDQKEGMAAFLEKRQPDFKGGY